MKPPEAVGPNHHRPVRIRLAQGVLAKIGEAVVDTEVWAAITSSMTKGEMPPMIAMTIHPPRLPFKQLIDQQQNMFPITVASCLRLF